MHPRFHSVKWRACVLRRVYSVRLFDFYNFAFAFAFFFFWITLADGSAATRAMYAATCGNPSARPACCLSRLTKKLNLYCKREHGGGCSESMVVGVARAWWCVLAARPHLNAFAMFEEID